MLVGLSGIFALSLFENISNRKIYPGASVAGDLNRNKGKSDLTGALKTYRFHASTIVMPLLSFLENSRGDYGMFDRSG